MNILTSFIYPKSLCPLAKFDTVSETLGWVASSGNIRDGRGICETRDFYLVGVAAPTVRDGGYGTRQSFYSHIYVYDKQFNWVTDIILKSVQDIHSLVSYKDIILMNKTSTDSVYSMILDGPNISTCELYLTVDADLKTSKHELNSNRYHINSVAFQGTDLIVSMFGVEQDDKKGGMIYNCSQQVVLKEGLMHPHTVKIYEDQIMFVESLRSCLHIGDTTIDIPGNYLRGITWDDQFIYVGTSARRAVSLREEGFDNLTYRSYDKCGIFAIDRSSLTISRFYDLSQYGKEIFDLMVI